MPIIQAVWCLDQLQLLHLEFGNVLELYSDLVSNYGVKKSFLCLSFHSASREVLLQVAAQTAEPRAPCKGTAKTSVRKPCPRLHQLPKGRHHVGKMQVRPSS